MPELMFFQDEDETARLPQDVEIVDAQVRPLPDGRRVVVQVTLTPFVEGPAFDVTILGPDGAVERTGSVVGAMERTNRLTMHLRRPPLPDLYTARIELMHAGSVLQARSVQFRLPNPADPPTTTT